MKGEQVQKVARIAADAARPLYGVPVRVLTIIYAADDPLNQSHAGTDFDRERVKAALRKALADLENPGEAVA